MEQNLAAVEQKRVD
jgi:hypothetical protein